MLMQTRTWVWLRTRITGLLHADTRIQRLLAPPETPDAS